MRPGRQTDILNTFTEMVAERGYDLVSVSDIAAALNLSKGTIMYHFGSKDRLLQQLSLDYMHRRTHEVEAIIESGVSSREALRRLVTGLMVAFRDDRAATIAFSREFMRFAEDPVMAEVLKMRRRYSELVGGIVERGVSSGDLRGVDPQIVTLQIIGMCNWSWTWFRPDGRLSAERVAEMYVDALLNGIAA